MQKGQIWIWGKVFSPRAELAGVTDARARDADGDADEAANVAQAKADEWGLAVRRKSQKGWPLARAGSRARVASDGTAGRCHCAAASVLKKRRRAPF